MHKSNSSILVDTYDCTGHYYSGFVVILIIVVEMNRSYNRSQSHSPQG